MSLLKPKFIATREVIMTLGPLMLDVEGLALTSIEKETLARPGVGGLILFKRNFASVTQVQSLTGTLKQF